MGRIAETRMAGRSIALALALAGVATMAAGPAAADPLLSLKIFDNGVLIGQKLNVAGGNLKYTTSSGPFAMSVAAQGTPVTANDNLAGLSIQTGSSLSGPQVLTIELTQFNLVPLAPSMAISSTVSANMLNAASVTNDSISTYIGVGAFDTSNLLNSETLNCPGNSCAGPTVTQTYALGATFSETEIYTATFNAPNSTLQWNSQVNAPAGAPIPEPFSLAILGSGLMGLLIARRRR